MAMTDAERQRLCRDRRRGAPPRAYNRKQAPLNTDAGFTRRTPTHALRAHTCDGVNCSSIARSPVGELVPGGWRRTLPGLLLCGNCYALRLTRLRLRNGYGSNA